MIAPNQSCRCLARNRIIVCYLVNSKSWNCPRNQNLKFFVSVFSPDRQIYVSDKITISRLFDQGGDITREARLGILVAMVINRTSLL